MQNVKEDGDAKLMFMFWSMPEDGTTGFRITEALIIKPNSWDGFYGKFCDVLSDL